MTHAAEILTEPPQLTRRVKQSKRSDLPDKILQAVADEFGIDVWKITSGSKQQPLPEARGVMVYLLRSLLGMPWEEVVLHVDVVSSSARYVYAQHVHRMETDKGSYEATMRLVASLWGATETHRAHFLENKEQERVTGGATEPEPEDPESPLCKLSYIRCRIVTRKIVERVADVYRITTEDVLGDARTKEVFEARALAIWTARECLDLGWKPLSRLFPRQSQPRDHTTIMNAYRRHVEHMSRCTDLADLSEGLREEFDQRSVP